MVLTWANSNYVLQFAPVANGPYTDVPFATSPYTTPANGSKGFFRLRMPILLPVLIDIDFDGAASGAAVVGSAGDKWNDFNSASSVPHSLMDASGNVTSVTISYSGENGFYSLDSFSQPNPSMMDGYAYNNTNGSIYVTLAGLSPVHHV